MAANRPAKVFVLQVPRAHFDISSAQKYGSVEAIFANRMTPYDSDFDKQVMSQLDLLGFDHRTDYLLVTGGVNALVIAASAMILRWKRLNVLLFDPVRGEYFDRVIGGAE